MSSVVIYMRVRDVSRLHVSEQSMQQLSRLTTSPGRTSGQEGSHRPQYTTVRIVWLSSIHNR